MSMISGDYTEQYAITSYVLSSMFHIVLEENVGNKSKLHLRFTSSQVRLAKHKDEVISELRQKKPSEVILIKE